MTKDARSQLAPEDLAQEVRWVRSLAAGLVSDPHLADDLAQDAWLSYAQRPPEHGRPRAWFRTVLRNTARNRFKLARNRESRERDAAAPEEPPGAVDMAVRLELSKRLIEAVEALDEPYREVVLLRFYEDLRPGEIAARLGRESSSVRTQLARALDRLRDQLDESYDGRQAWAGVALALRPRGGAGAGTSVPQSTTAATSSPSIPLVGLAVGALGALGVLGAVRWSGDRPQTAQMGDDPGSVVRSTPGQPEAPRTDSGSREAVLVHGPAIQAAQELHGSVTSGGRVLENAWLEVENAAGQDLDATLDAQGGFSFGDVGPGPWVVRAGAPRAEVVSLEVNTLDSIRDEGLHLTLSSDSVVLVRVLTPSGDPHPLTQAPFSGQSPFRAPGRAVATDGPAPEVFRDYLGPIDAELSMARLRAPVAGEVTAEEAHGLLGILDLPRTQDVWIHLLYGSHVVASKPFTEAVQGQLVFPLAPTAHLPLQGGVTSSHVDSETGAVLQGFGFGKTPSPIAIETLGTYELRADGTHVGGLPPGWMRSSAIFFGEGAGQAWVDRPQLVWLDPGDSLDRTERPATPVGTVSLRLVDSSGSGVAGSLALWSERTAYSPRDMLLPDRRAVVETDGTQVYARQDVPLALAIQAPAGVHWSAHRTLGAGANEVLVPEDVFELSLDGTALQMPRRVTLADDQGFPFWTGVVARNEIVEVNTAELEVELWIGVGDRVDVDLPIHWEDGIANVLLEEWVQ